MPVIRAFISARFRLEAALSAPVDLLRFFQIYDFRPACRGDRNSSASTTPVFLPFVSFQPALSRKRRRELSSHRVNSAPDMRNWDLSWVDDRRHAFKQGHVEQLNIHGLARRRGERERER